LCIDGKDGSIRKHPYHPKSRVRKVKESNSKTEAWPTKTGAELVSPTPYQHIPLIFPVHLSTSIWRLKRTLTNVSPAMSQLCPVKLRSNFLQ